MGRLQQLNPSNYTASPRINEEFDSVIRYLVSAERGNKTLNEMLTQIFNVDGELENIIEMRLDQSAGIQYRVGSYTNTTDGWVSLATLDSIKGSDGSNLGTVVLPVLTSRTDATGDGSETDFAYTFEDEDSPVVYKNGLLQRPGASYDYTLGTNEIIFNSAPANNDDLTFYKIRSDPSVGTVRTDVTPPSNQTIFVYAVPTVAYQLFVYKNGLLLREGVSHDYVVSSGANTVTFTSTVTNSDTITFLEVSSTNETTITGLMTEETYVDGTTGQILYSKLGIADGAVPQAKVADLATDIAARAVLAVSATEPTSPSTGNMWLDTSSSPNVLKFFDGVRYNSTSPENAIPTFDSSNANQYVRVNGTGSALTVQDLDLSGLIPTTQKGAANGVSSLDSSGLIPEAQMPEVRCTDNLYHFESGAVANGTYTVARSYKQTTRIIALSAILASGTCQLQLKVAGILVGSVYAVSSTALDQPLATLIEVDSTTASKTIAVEVTSQSSANGLEVTLSTELLE